MTTCKMQKLMFQSSLDVCFKWKSTVSIRDFDMSFKSKLLGRCVYWQAVFSFWMLMIEKIGTEELL
jgi:hypothetical protein